MRTRIGRSPTGGCGWSHLAGRGRYGDLAVAIELFGQVLQVSHWVLDTRRFTHTPRPPGGMVVS